MRWLQEVRRFQPSTVSRRLSIVVGFARVCVIDGLLPTRPPTTCVGHPFRPSHPTLGPGHLQGVAGGMPVPAGQIILARAAGPARMGRVMGTVGIAVVLAPVSDGVCG